MVSICWLLLLLVACFLLQFTVFISVRNDGTALGIGSSTSTCVMRVNVTQVPLPPELTNTVFYVAELKPAGTLVGNVLATDPNNYTVSSIRFGNAEMPNAFAINNQGNITVTQTIDSLALLKNSWKYLVRDA